MLPYFAKQKMLILIPIFFLIAILYSTVGLGGGSAYIAVMLLAGIPKDTLPVIALGCNLIVASQGFFRFKQAGHFRWSLFWPFATTSIPMAYLGGRLHISDKTFTIILAVALIVAALRLLLWSPHLPTSGPLQWEKNKTLPKLIIGAALGFFSGITGIGGGIYLIPAILFFKMSDAKEAAAVASLFIVVNSISGLAGQLSKHYFDWHLFLPLAAAVLVGGFIGARLGATKLTSGTLQKITGTILFIAALKLIIK